MRGETAISHATKTSLNSPCLFRVCSIPIHFSILHSPFSKQVTYLSEACIMTACDRD
jgi:hypothetical protein